MRLWPRGLLLAVLFLMLSAPEPGAACGDKFVRVGRGGRYQRGYVAVHPASVLVYVDAGSKQAPALRRLTPALKAAGHKAAAVESEAALADALKGARYDVVLIEAAEVARVEPELGKAAPKPSVLPVLYNPTKAELEEQVKLHGCVVEDADKKYDVLVEIDGVMERRSK